MFKILIVDDQSLIRKGIIKMINWDDHSAILIGEADNGNNALEILRGQDVDIVITDMRMPGLDGITLLKNICKSYPQIKTIVISGYDDFEYAQQALKSGSINYILKPVNPKELNESIKKARELIKKEKSYLVIENDNLLKKGLNNLLQGSPRDNDLVIGYLEDVNINNSVVCCVIIKNTESDRDRITICDDLNGSLMFQKVFLIQDINECTLMFWSKIDQNIKIFEELVYNRLKDVIGKIITPKSKIILSIGKICEGVQIKDSYASAREIMPYSLLKDMTPIVLRYTELAKNKSYTIPVDEYESELIMRVTSGNVSQVERILDDLIQNVFERKDISIDSIKLLISNLCHILLKVDIGLVDELQLFFKKINSPDYFLAFDSIENIKQLLYNLYRFATQKYLKEKGGKEALILNVKEFINKNYVSEIGLKEISEIFHVNASYLSNLFKKETNENLNQYISGVRMKNAMKILENSDVKVSELALMVGYSDYVYFQKIFKKIVGKTIKEYRICKHNTMQ